MRWSLAALVGIHLLLRVAFATVDLHGDRFWDERFGLENLSSLLVEGRVKPANGYHPTLSYLPQAAVLGVVEALYRVTDDERLRLFVPVETESGRRARRVDYSPLAFLLCRLVQAVFGAASLLVVYLVGKRLFSAPAGLLAAGILGSMPWHVRQSTIFKPDILLLLLIATALLLFLRAFEQPTPRRFALAGVGIGLALAAKFNAAPIALPLVVGAAIEVLRGGSAGLWLRRVAIAGAAALATFLVLVPFVLIEPQIYLEDFSIILEDYEEKGDTRAGGSSLVALARGVEALLSDNFFGAAIGAVACAGFALLSFWPWPKSASPAQRHGRAMTASYALGYAASYGLATANPSPHNWLPVTPVFALFAAGLVAEIWGRFTGRSAVASSRSHGSQWLAASALAVVVVALTVRPTRYVYETVVPATADRAAQIVFDELGGEEARGEPRIAAIESQIDLPRIVGGSRSAASPGIERWSARDSSEPTVEPTVEPGASDPRLADAVVFLERGGYTSGHSSVRTSSADPAWLRARGPALGVAFHLWVQVGSPETLEWEVGPDGRIVAELPVAAPAQISGSSAETHWSFELLVRAEEPAPELGGLVLGAERLPWLRAGRVARRFRYLTPRVATIASGDGPGDAPSVRLELRPADHPDADRIELRRYRWAPPGSDSGDSTSDSTSSPASGSGDVATDSR